MAMRRRNLPITTCASRPQQCTPKRSHRGKSAYEYGELLGTWIVYIGSFLLLGLFLWVLWLVLSWAGPKVLIYLVAIGAWLYQGVIYVGKLMMGIALFCGAVWLFYSLSTETTYLGPRGGRFRVRHSRRSGKQYKQYF
jgi:hypothetical protein